MDTAGLMVRLGNLPFLEMELQTQKLSRQYLNYLLLCALGPHDSSPRKGLQFVRRGLRRMHVIEYLPAQGAEPNGDVKAPDCNCRRKWQPFRSLWQYYMGVLLDCMTLCHYGPSLLNRRLRYIRDCIILLLQRGANPELMILWKCSDSEKTAGAMSVAFLIQKTETWYLGLVSDQLSSLLNRLNAPMCVELYKRKPHSNNLLYKLSTLEVLDLQHEIDALKTSGPSGKP